MSCKEELRVSVKVIFRRGGPLLGFHTMVLGCVENEQQQLWCVPSGVSEKVYTAGLETLVPLQPA